MLPFFKTNRKGAPLRGIEMFDHDHRDLGPAELLRRQNPAVTRDNALLCIDQHRHIEAETLDAALVRCDLVKSPSYAKSVPAKD